jgi:hypothetical protein
MAVVLSLTTAISAVLGALVVAGIVPPSGLLFGCVAVGAAIVGLAQRVEVDRPLAAARVEGATVAISNQRIAGAPATPLEGPTSTVKAR